MEPPKAHPAKWSAPILERIGQTLAEEAPLGGRLLDPFAGVGLPKLRLFAGSGWDVYGMELEPEWGAASDPRCLVGDSTKLPFPTGSFQAAASSPSYANRMSDHHEAKDACKKCAGAGWVRLPATAALPSGDRATCPTCRGSGLSKRNTYRHVLGRMPSDGSTAVLSWANRKERLLYQAIHIRVIDALIDVLEPGGLALWNVSNHMRTTTKGAPPIEYRVVEWHLSAWLSRGCYLLADHPIATKRQKQGANRDNRADREHLLVFRTPPQRTLL